MMQRKKYSFGCCGPRYRISQSERRSLERNIEFAISLVQTRRICASESSWDCRRSVVCHPAGNEGLVHVRLVAVLGVAELGNIGEALNTRPTFRSSSAVGVCAELLRAVDESRWHDDRRTSWAGVATLEVTDGAAVGTAAGVSTEKRFAQDDHRRHRR